jgi:NDP-sugar pyrophosphorylase family protein
MLSVEQFLDLRQTHHASLFDALSHPWEALSRLNAYILDYLQHQPARESSYQGAYVGEQVAIGKDVVIEPGAMIQGPAVIGDRCQIRHNATLRANVIVGDGCVVGSACELKQCLLFNEVAVSHMNYVGDSILGFQAHLGAGAKLSNYKWNGESVVIRSDHDPKCSIQTGLNKFGAIVGNQVEVGCNAVICPGSLIGPRSVIYPNTLWRGVLPEDRVVKHLTTQQIVDKRIPGQVEPGGRAST